MTSSSNRAAGLLGDISPHQGQICSFLNGCLTRNRILWTSPGPHRKSATSRRGCNAFRLLRERCGVRHWRCCLLLEVMCSIFCGVSGSCLHPDGWGPWITSRFIWRGSLQSGNRQPQIDAVGAADDKRIRGGAIEAGDNRGWKSDYLFIQLITDTWKVETKVSSPPWIAGQPWCSRESVSGADDVTSWEAVLQESGHCFSYTVKMEDLELRQVRTEVLGRVAGEQGRFLSRRPGRNQSYCMWPQGPSIFGRETSPNVANSNSQPEKD